MLNFVQFISSTNLDFTVILTTLVLNGCKCWHWDLKHYHISWFKTLTQLLDEVQLGFLREAVKRIGVPKVLSGKWQWCKSNLKLNINLNLPGSLTFYWFQCFKISMWATRLPSWALKNFSKYTIWWGKESCCNWNVRELAWWFDPCDYLDFSLRDTTGCWLMTLNLIDLMQ